MKYKIINYIEANIVRNNYLNSLNKAKLDYDNSTNEKIIGKDLEEYIESGLHSLSPKVKVVFEMSRKEKMSVNEIAQKLNVSEQTVKNQISKAIKALRLHLNNISISITVFTILYGNAGSLF